jgi:hypothetical protein
MSIAGIASSILFQPQALQTNYSQQFQTEFQQLGKDLQAGNITSAQQDFATLQQDLQQGASGNQVQHHHHHHPHAEESQSPTSQPQSQIAQTFNSLGQDLQSGNASAARQAFSALQQEFQQLGGVATSNNPTPTAGSVNLTA